MKSINPGHGPSMMGGIGSLYAAIFGLLWTISALSMDAPPVFAVFGVAFILMALVSGAYHLHNATGKNRFSELDITEEGEEPDPLSQQEHHRFCPGCGQPLQADYDFCPSCGRKTKQEEEEA